MAVSINPYQGPNTLRSIALGHEINDRKARTNLAERQQDFVEQRAEKSDAAQAQSSQRQLDQAAYEVGLQLLQLPNYQTFRNALPLAAQTGLFDEEDMATFNGITEETYPKAAEKFSAAVKSVIGPDGQPALAQFGDQGSARIIPDLKPTPSKGETIEIDPETGAVRISRGVTPASPLSNSAATETQKDIMSDSELLASTRNVISTFKPEYQTVEARWDAMITSGKAKLGGDIAPADEMALRDFSDYKANAANLQSRVINQLAGAAVSESEAKRINGFLIDPGTGLFDGDDPITAEAKLKRYERNIEWAIARKQWFLRNGIEANESNWNKHSLGDMPKIIRERHGEIVQELSAQNPEMSAGDIQKMAIEKGKREFGLL